MPNDTAHTTTPAEDIVAYNNIRTEEEQTFVRYYSDKSTAALRNLSKDIAALPGLVCGK